MAAWSPIKNPEHSHVVVIPSYNTGRDLLAKTVQGALANWPRVWLFIDGSTDGSGEALRARQEELPGLTIFLNAENRGKGATVECAAEEANAAGVTHILLMDADGQHPAEAIPAFMEASAKNPGAMIMGEPQFGSDVPWERFFCRRVGIFFTHLETLWGGLADTLFGFRVYPVEPLRVMFRQTRRGARGYNFDPEAAVRLFWMGVQPLRRSVPVRYLSKEEGGISHYHYIWDTLNMFFLHWRMVPQAVPRFRQIARYRRQWKQEDLQT